MRSLDEMIDAQDKIREWQQKQFPDCTLYGAMAHLERERKEAAEELADVFHLATHAQTLGADTGALAILAWIAISNIGVDPASAVLGKLAKNKARQWPDTPDNDGVFSHIIEK